MIKKKITILLILLYSVISVSAHDAHEHGVAEMQILIEKKQIEKKQIEIIMYMPGADFIGFEHENLTDKEKEAIHEKIGSLESSGDDLISFRTRHWMKLVMNELHIGEAGHEEDEEEDHVKGHELGEHMEFELHFIYSMEDSENLKDMQLSGLFRAFPTLSEIHWIMISDSGQTAGETEASNSRIHL